MSMEKDIKDAIKEKKLLMGSKSVIKAAKAANLSLLIYASNTPQNVRRDIMHYANVSGMSTQEFPGTSVHLGELCGKPFNILLLGIRK